MKDTNATQQSYLQDTLTPVLLPNTIILVLLQNAIILVLLQHTIILVLLLQSTIIPVLLQGWLPSAQASVCMLTVYKPKCLPLRHKAPRALSNLTQQ